MNSWTTRGTSSLRSASEGAPQRVLRVRSPGKIVHRQSRDELRSHQAHSIPLRVRDAQETLSSEHGHAPTVSQLSQYLELETEQVIDALQATQAYESLSLDAPRPGGEDDTITFGDGMGSEDERPVCEIRPPLRPGVALKFCEAARGSVSDIIGVNGFAGAGGGGGATGAAGSTPFCVPFAPVPPWSVGGLGKLTGSIVHCPTHAPGSGTSSSDTGAT